MGTRRKKKNPKGAAAAIAVIGVIGVGVLVGWQLMSSNEEKKASKKPKKGEGIKVVEEYGLVFNADCSDFSMKDPPAGADTSKERQSVAMMEIVDTAVKAGGNIDPFALTNTWFGQISPSACKWPPTSASPARIANAYIFLTTLLAMMVIDRNGTVLGVTNADPEYADILDQKIIEKAAQMGLVWNPAVIPDLIPQQDLPDLAGSGMPVVDEAIPASFPQSDSVKTVTLLGENLDLEDIEFRLRDGDTGVEANITAIEEMVDEDDNVLSTRVNLLFTTSYPGRYTVSVRREGEEWEETPAMVMTTVSQSGFQPKA